MKFKTLFVSALACLFSLGASAQTPNAEVKPDMSYWFLGVQGGIGATRGESNFKELVSPAAALYAGYRFNPYFALRLNANGWTGKGYLPTVDKGYKYNYGQLGLDGMLDLTTCFGGVNPNRIVSVWALGGVGFLHSMNNDEAFDLKKSLTADLPLNNAEWLELYWENRNYVTGRMGLHVDFRLCDRVNFNVEGVATVMDDHFNSKDAGNADWQFNALAGFCFRLGKINKPAPIVAVPEPVVPEEPKVEEPKPAPAPAPAPVVEEVKPCIQNVFFLINRYDIRPSEMQKVDEAVAYLNKYPEAKIDITGYADKNTGNATINERLSKQRVNSVYNALLQKGIAAERIHKDYKGDTVQPFSNDEANYEKNRVVICVAE